MTKVKIKTVVDTGRKTKDGRPVLTVELEDGGKGSAFDEKFKELQGQEADVDIKENGEYQGVKQYIYNLAKDQTKKAFPQKDYAFEKRKAALENAVSSINKIDKQVTSDGVLVIAEKYFQFLNTK